MLFESGDHLLLLRRRMRGIGMMRLIEKKCVDIIIESIEYTKVRDRKEVELRPLRSAFNHSLYFTYMHRYSVQVPREEAKMI